MLKESLDVALSYIKINAEKLKINIKSLKDSDIHLHIPQGAIPKDGPSAGITILVALISSFSGKQVPQNIAMTGELSLGGKVLAIGGLKDKLNAAVRESITTVIIPEENQRELIDIPDEIKQALTIKTVSSVNEILETLFNKE